MDTKQAVAGMDPAEATIFVVDDDEAVRRGLTRLLRSAGWNVEALASAGDFVRRAPLNGPGCILLDVQLPDESGLELQGRLLQAGISLPVVFLTGKGDIPMSVCAMKRGAIDFLVKPVDDDVLFEAVGAAIRSNLAQAAGQGGRAAVTARLALLTEREREILQHVLRGRLNKQIAYDLGIAEKTVKVHRGRVMQKMEAQSVAALVHMCDSIGIGTDGGA